MEKRFSASSADATKVSVATIRYGEFEWDSAKAAKNERKHGVSFDDAATVFSDPHAIDAPDLAEPVRFVIIGESRLTRILFVVFAEKAGAEVIRIISARRAAPAQRKRYEDG